MRRRTFLASCAAGAGSVALAGGAQGQQASSKGPFADVKLKMSLPIGWFKGSTDERLEQIAAWGFPAYEWLNPEGDLDALRSKADSLGLELSCIVGVGAIRPGQMMDPKRHDSMVKQFRDRVKMAHKLGCKRLIGLTGNERRDVSREQQTQYVIQCLKRVAPIAEDENVTIVMEALNPLVDHRGYFLTRTDQTMDILKAVDSPNVKMCFDIYHQQITEGNVIRNITRNIGRIGHFHVADNPGRKEPGTGELNYKNIFKAIYEARDRKSERPHDGFVAMECGQTRGPEGSLKALLECFDWS